MLPDLLYLTRKQKSITQEYSPTYRKSTGLKAPVQKKKSIISQQTIRADYIHLDSLIQNLETSLNQRLDKHQKQLLSIMKAQMNKMLEDIRKIVKAYNTMIKQKNCSQDLWQTKNEVEYFKYQAIKIFQQNKLLKLEISRLKQQIQSLTFQQKCQSIALKRITKKLIKQKTIKRNVISAEEKIKDKNIKVNNYNQQSLLLARKRQSLSTNLPKFTKKQHTSQKQYIDLKSNIQSTLSKTEVEKEIVKTQGEQSQKIFSSPKLHSFSQRIKLLYNNGRSQKIKFLKQRSSFNRNHQKSQNNQLLTLLNENL